MKNLLQYFLFCSLIIALASENYNGYKVYRVWPESNKHKQILTDLEELGEVDVWKELSNYDPTVDIMVGPHDQSMFENRMKSKGLKISVFIANVSTSLGGPNFNQRSSYGMTWTAYHTLDDIYEWFKKLEIRYPNFVSIVVGGLTYENREIRGVKLSFAKFRNAVFLEGGLHSREWISPATVTYIINELLISRDNNLRRVAESFDWYIFPVTNPDGYVYTHTTNRCWRKTRTYYRPKCRGADANRNWDSHWGKFGSSKKCTSTVYHGPKVFSERCTKALSQFIRKLSPNLVGYFAFHSYSQRLMVPFGYTTDHLENYNETMAISNVAIKALAKRHGTKYTTGNVAETIYRASGGSVDWVKQEFHTPLVYVYEMRDGGTYGFLLPPNQIIPNSEEIVDSLVAIFLEADKLNVVNLVR